MSAWAAPRRHYWMEATPGSVQLRSSMYDPAEGPPKPSRAGGKDAPRPGRPTRSKITGFSSDSRERLRRRAVSLPWENAVGPGGIGMVTFTYPEAFPTDGEVSKAQLKRLYERWRRRYGKPRGMWKMEFQQRGAPHFHCFVGLPEPEDELRAWLLRQWYEVVRSGDERHRFHGVDISRWRWGTLGENRARVGEYFARHGAKGWKSYQNRVPEGYVSPGQFWGVWGLKPDVRVFPLDWSEFVQHRRLAWTLDGKNRQRKVRKGGGDKGAFAVSVDGHHTGLRWVGALRPADDGREPA
ncbi:MAG TPA: hypothetical protein VEI83_01225 [Acidimicrobiales bacterium]|nr:hypothetical protein [Acidimicrobiales bacterium]